MYSRIVVASIIALQLAASHGVGAQSQAGKPAARSASAINAAVVAQEQSIYDAITRKDTVAFNKALGRDFVYVDRNGSVQWALSKTSTMMKDCGLGSKWTIDHPMTTEFGGDIVVLTYSSSGKSTCNGQPSPSPVNVLSVWQKRGTHWVAVAHSETPAASKQ